MIARSNPIEIIEAESKPVPDAGLVKIVKESGLDETRTSEMVLRLSPIVVEAGKLIQAASEICVTKVDQVEEIVAAGRVRRAMVKLRTKTERVHKEIKADALAYGKTADACRRWILERLDPVEQQLRLAETFAERAEAERVCVLRESRAAALRAEDVDTRFMQLAEMDEPSYQSLLRRSIADREARAKDKADRKAERERASEERVRMDAENAELRETAERAQAMAREAGEKAAALQRSIDEKNDRERKRVEAEEAKARKDHAERLAVARAAQEAPDREKLKALASDLRALPMPTMATSECEAFVVLVRTVIGKLATRIEEVARLGHKPGDETKKEDQR